MLLPRGTGAEETYGSRALRLPNNSTHDTVKRSTPVIRRETDVNVLTISITIGFILTSSDVLAGPTSLVSTKSQKEQSNGASSEPATSDTGQFVAFRSSATTLHSQRCNNGLNHIFVRDRSARTTRCVSVNTNDQQADQDSHAPSISADGQFIAFDSAATNLSGGRCNNGVNHIFVRDRTTGTTRCVSVRSNGTEGDGDSFDPSISANGQIVVFHSTATNLAARCSNGNSHVYMHDLPTGQTSCVSVNSDGNESNGNSDLARVSGNGLFVAFESAATDLTSQCNNGFAHIFVRDLVDNRTSCVSMDNRGNEGNNDSMQAAISFDGRLVAYSSAATNLTTTRCIAGNIQVFVRDRVVRNTTCASVGLRRVEGNGDSINPSISGNGVLVSFESNANNLVNNDTNGLSDVFVHVLP